MSKKILWHIFRLELRIYILVKETEKCTVVIVCPECDRYRWLNLIGKLLLIKRTAWIMSVRVGRYNRVAAGQLLLLPPWSNLQHHGRLNPEQCSWMLVLNHLRTLCQSMVYNSSSSSSRSNSSSSISVVLIAVVVTVVLY